MKRLAAFITAIAVALGLTLIPQATDAKPPVCRRHCPPTTTTTTSPSTTTTISGSTTTTVAPTTSTTTTIPSGTTTTVPSGGAAFSETFSGGALDPTRFTAAHWRNDETGELDPTLNGSKVLVENGTLRIESGEQNYGDSAVRINQPFDFAGRTGTFSTDVTLIAKDGWTRLTLSEDPYAVTSYGDDNAAGQGANRGIDLKIQNFAGCPVVELRTYANRVETDYPGPGYVGCDAVGSDTRLDHVVVTVSNSSVTIKVGSVTIGSWSGLNLGFSRGYWYLDAHNHATNKYAGLPTWITHWDNPTFDGPVIAPLNVTVSPTIEGRSVPGVPATPGSPRLIFNAQHGQQDASPTLSYALNGHISHLVPLVRLPGLIGVYMLSLPVDPAELVTGSNSVVFTWTGTTGLPPRVADLQLVWTTGGSPPPPTSTTTTTVASTTTTTTSTTTTTIPSGTASCGIVNAAFCDTFDQPYTGPQTQTGDLNPVLWGVSRSGFYNPSQGLINSFVMSHNACANGAQSPIPSDIRICNGQMVESQNDGGGVTITDTYPKQPFNFAGRTGKIVFDVSADSEGTHAAWPEFEITDEPIPVTHGFTSCCDPFRGAARNSIGFSIANCGCGYSTNETGVDHIFMSSGDVYSEIPMTHYDQITKGSRGAMNHIEVYVSTTRIDIWGTDAGSTTLKHLAGGNMNLTFSQGLVWLNDVHYNARKAIEPGELGTQYDHSFAWDNLGFDGPKTYRDWGFDVPYANIPDNASSSSGDPTYVQEGFQVGSEGRDLTITGVNKGVATSAKLVLNTSIWYATTISASVNGHTPVSHALRGDFQGGSFSIPIPLSDIVNGTNTVRLVSDDNNTVAANITLIMVAAGSVP